MRQTKQKKIIQDVLEKLRYSHPTALDVLFETQKIDPSISKTTVYRNLRELSQKGLIWRIEEPSSMERYDVNTHSHAHFKCTKCSRIEDVDIDIFEIISTAFKEQKEGKLSNINIMLLGECSNCQKQD